MRVPELQGDRAHHNQIRKTGFFGKQAAGCLPLARDTGRFLLVRRSALVLEPGTWANVGGAHHADEYPRAAAARELIEETGYCGPVEMLPLSIFRQGSFEYRLFLALVDHEFIPDLGWEADAFEWCTLDQLPHPLHFGMEALLSWLLAQAAS